MYASSPITSRPSLPEPSPRTAFAARLLRSVASRRAGRTGPNSVCVASQSPMVASASASVASQSVASGVVSRPERRQSQLRPSRPVEMRSVIASRSSLPCPAAYRREGPRKALARAFRHMKRAGMASKVARLARRFADPSVCGVASVASVERRQDRPGLSARVLH